MKIPEIAAALSVEFSIAKEIHHSIHNNCSPLAVQQKFNRLLGRLHLYCTDHLADLSRDQYRFDAAEIWLKHTGEPAPMCFDDFSSSDSLTLTQLRKLLSLEFETSAAFAKTLAFTIDGTDIVVQGLQFNAEGLGELAKDMAQLGYIRPDQAEFLDNNSKLMPLNAARDLKTGDVVAFNGPPGPQKLIKYHSSNIQQKHIWPNGHINQLGRVTYVYSSDNILDVSFANGRTFPIHSSHIIRIITSHGKFTSLGGM
jgi:hypothetical protein